MIYSCYYSSPVTLYPPSLFAGNTSDWELVGAYAGQLFHKLIFKDFREHKILRISFWVKLAFILADVALAIGKLLFLIR
jgi:hypothetical protein